jgi:ornithine cyclodeaminase
VSSARLLTEHEVRSLITVEEARHAVRDAFVALHHGDARNTTVLEVRLPHNGGELHGKGAYIVGSTFLTVKMATGFPANRESGLPESGGLSMAFDAATGILSTILFDNGFLTQLRTGAAGALAAELLARPDAHRVAIVGAGLQARYQLEALLALRPLSYVGVSSRTRRHAETFAEESSRKHGVTIIVHDTVEEAVDRADIVVTTTPAEEPVVLDEWLRPGTHVTAVGSDFPGKQELALGVLASADLVVADDFCEGKDVGEVANAVAHGVLDPASVVSLGAVAAGEHPGRTSDSQVTVADLTGIGVQDAAVSGIVIARALDRHVGAHFETAAGSPVSSGPLFRPDGREDAP